MKKILVVDDEAIIAMNTSMLLKSEGYETDEVYSGEQCLGKLEEGNRPDVILLDIDLGPNRIDGTETARRINELYSLPVVFYSGHTDRETISRTEEINNYGYVQKAAGNRQFLLATIKMALRLYSTERENKEKERYYRLLANNSTDVIITFDFQFNITYVSPASMIVSGFTPKEILSLKLQDLVAPDSFKEILTLPKKLRSGENVKLTLELEHYHKEGNSYWAEDTITILKDDGGTAIGYLATVRDISKRKLYARRMKKSEEFHRESESRLNAILSSMSDIVFAFDNKGRFTFYNLSSMDDLCAPPQHFMGKTYWEVMPEHLHDLFNRAFQKTLKGETDKYEYSMKLEGKTRWFLAKHSPIVVRGQVEGSVSVIRDITDGKHQEKSLRDTLERRENSIKEIHHRIKNNLAIIVSLINLKNREADDQRDYDELINQIETIRIIHEKLYQSDDLETVDMQQYIEDLLSRIAELIGEEYYEIRSKIEKVKLSPDQAIPLGLITNEIVTNAVQHGPEKGEKMIIDIEMHTDDHGRLVYSIGNSGKAFPEHIAPKEQDTLGLQMIHLLVEQLNGDIHLRKVPSPLFTIIIPMSGGAE